MEQAPAPLPSVDQPPMSQQYAPPSSSEAFAPQSYAVDDEIDLDARDDGNDRAGSRSPGRVAFKGSIIAKKANGGLLLKSTSTNGKVKIDTLMHLPPSATVELEKSRHGGDSIKQSLQGGRGSSPVEISHANGKWSIRETSSRQARK